MGLSVKAEEYLNYKRAIFEKEQDLPHPQEDRSGDILYSRGYIFRDHISRQEKERENLEILKDW